MLKRSSKKLAIMLVLSMLATMFIGVGAASAASTYSVLSIPTVLSNDREQALGTIQIDIAQMEDKQQSLLVTLPTDFVINYQYAKAYVAKSDVDIDPKFDETVLDSGIKVSGIKVISDREFKITFDPKQASSDVRILVELSRVKVPSSASEEVTATFTNLKGNFSGGSVVIAKTTGTGDVTASVVTTVTVGEGGSGSDVFEINLKENTADALRVGKITKIKLSKGIHWNTVTVENLTDGVIIIKDNEVIQKNEDEEPVWTIDKDDETLELKKLEATGAKKIYRISATVDVDEDEAVLGDIKATISGSNNINPSSLVVGTYAEYDVVAKVVGDVETIKAGQLEQDVADFNIEENAKASLLAGRNISLELPSGAKWYNIEATPSGINMNHEPTISSDGRTLKFKIDQASSSKAKIKFTDVQVVTAVDFTGDLTVTVSGAGIEETELVLATVEPAIIVTAQPTEIKTGIQEQAIGDITISESVAETFIKNGVLVLELPNGVEWSEIPDVEVTEGDLEIDENDIDINDEILTIGIDSQSSEPSTITISNIKVDLNRSVSEGKVKVKISGTAVDEVNNVADGDGGTWEDTIVDNGKIFPRNTKAAEVVVAKVVTPADSNVINEAKFVIGATTYTINGKEATMDVAPYIANSRTYMPVRYIANAMGIDDNNILWDANTQTVTLLGANKVVQLKIGSNTILVNGAAIAMDVAPEITNSRTMLPARFVAQAFGYNVGWDEATQTVTLN